MSKKTKPISEEDLSESNTKRKKRLWLEKQKQRQSKEPSDQNRRTREQRVVHWGKYAGTRFIDVPTDYLEWFAKNAYRQMKNRKQWTIEELEARKLEESTIIDKQVKQ